MKIISMSSISLTTKILHFSKSVFILANDFANCCSKMEIVSKTFLCFSWCQDHHGIPLGLLTEGSIEVCNKDVKDANR